ncbi:MAG: cation diffusion facilitator family transporter [Clostridia bacterium]|nr:cation diffusion facilitator family transporter [Clostridia bacterium]
MQSKQRIALITVVAGGILNLALAITKLYIGLRTNSVSILSDATNNFIDIASCIVVAFAFFMAAKAATKKYPYGFGRAEYLAGFVVSVIVVLVGLNFVYASIARLMMPVPVWFSWLFFWIVAATAIVKLGMAEFYRRIDRRLASGAIKALMLDSYIDTAITVMALIGFLLAGYSGLRLDALFGLITGIAIVLSGTKLLIINTGALIGRGATHEQNKAVEDICAEYTEIKYVGFYLHNYGASKSNGIVEVEYTENIEAEKIKEINASLAEQIKNKISIDIQIMLGR